MTRTALEQLARPICRRLAANVARRLPHGTYIGDVEEELLASVMANVQKLSGTPTRDCQRIFIVANKRATALAVAQWRAVHAAPRLDYSI